MDDENLQPQRKSPAGADLRGAQKGSYEHPTRRVTGKSEEWKLPKALAPLTTLPHWTVWRFKLTDKGKPTKVPYQPNGRPAKSDDPQTWS